MSVQTLFAIYTINKLKSYKRLSTRILRLEVKKKRERMSNVCEILPWPQQRLCGLILIASLACHLEKCLVMSTPCLIQVSFDKTVGRSQGCIV